jgi:hypothetical protein
MPRLLPSIIVVQPILTRLAQLLIAALPLLHCSVILSLFFVTVTNNKPAMGAHERPLFIELLW